MSKPVTPLDSGVKIAEYRVTVFSPSLPAGEAGELWLREIAPALERQLQAVGATFFGKGLGIVTVEKL